MISSLDSYSFWEIYFPPFPGYIGIYKSMSLFRGLVGGIFFFDSSFKWLGVERSILSSLLIFLWELLIVMTKSFLFYEFPLGLTSTFVYFY